jgi:hypothetical protein
MLHGPPSVLQLSFWARYIGLKLNAATRDFDFDFAARTYKFKRNDDNIKRIGVNPGEHEENQD